jgi:hypothetical protein
MISILLAAALIAPPARAATARVEIAAPERISLSAPAIAPQGSPIPILTPSLTAAPSLSATPVGAAPTLAPTPIAAAPALAPVALPALALSPAPRPAAADAPDEPAYRSRIRGFLGRINPFGAAAAEQSPPANEAERLDREFSKLDFWEQAGPRAKDEILDLRARGLTKEQTKEYVRAQVNAAFERVKAARGSGNIGFHFNLHGGRREDYVGSGIRASKGDIALRYSMNADANDKVYFFQTAAHDAYTALDASNGEILFFPSRMGHALNVFALDAPELEAARADGRITDGGSIAMNFHKGMRGVPYSAYLAPPLTVFVDTAKKVGLKKLSRDEETLATARYLEAALTVGGAFVPR